MRTWTDTHPEAFVMNLRRATGAKAPTLHRVGCPAVAPRPPSVRRHRPDPCGYALRLRPPSGRGARHGAGRAHALPPLLSLSCRHLDHSPAAACIGGTRHDDRRTVRAMLLVAASPALDHHDVGPRHPERPARVQAALAGIDEAGLRDAVVTLEPRRATIEELSLVHPVSYLDALHAFCDGRRWPIDPDTIASSGSWDTALLAAGAALEVVDALGRGDGDVAFVAARPPGHHALAAEPMGFCLLNNIAVAAATLGRARRACPHRGLGRPPRQRDPGHLLGRPPGALRLDPPVAPVSRHGPRVGDRRARRAPGLTVNVPLPPRATGDVVLAALDDVVAPVVERFAPTWVLASAGTTPIAPTPWPGSASPRATSPTSPGASRPSHPQPGRLALLLEGGYDLDALRLSVGASLAAVLDVEFRPEHASSGGPGDDAVGRGASSARRDLIGCGTTLSTRDTDRGNRARGARYGTGVSRTPGGLDLGRSTSQLDLGRPT